MDGEKLSSDLGNLASCDPHYPENCLISSERYIWDTTDFKFICSFVKKGTYEATVSDKHIIIDALQGAFSKDPVQIHSLYCCLIN